MTDLLSMIKKKLSQIFEIWKKQSSPGKNNPIDLLFGLCLLYFDGEGVTVPQFKTYVYRLKADLEECGETIPETLVSMCVLKGLDGRYENKDILINAGFHNYRLNKLFDILETFEELLVIKSLDQSEADDSYNSGSTKVEHLQP